MSKEARNYTLKFKADDIIPELDRRNMEGEENGRSNAINAVLNITEDVVWNIVKESNSEDFQLYIIDATSDGDVALIQDKIKGYLQSRKIEEVTVGKPMTEFALVFRYCDIAPEIAKQTNNGAKCAYTAAINEVLLIPQGTIKWFGKSETKDEENDRYTIIALSDGDVDFINERQRNYLQSRGIEI